MVSTWTTDKAEGFSVTLSKASLGDRQLDRLSFGVITDYRDSSKKSEAIELLRVVAQKSTFIDKESRDATYDSCGELASWEGEVRLHYGSEQTLNQCILTKMSENDRELWDSVYVTFPRILEAAIADGNAPTAALETVYAAKGG